MKLAGKATVDAAKFHVGSQGGNVLVADGGRELLVLEAVVTQASSSGSNCHDGNPFIAAFRRLQQGRWSSGYLQSSETHLAAARPTDRRV